MNILIFHSKTYHVLLLIIILQSILILIIYVKNPWANSLDLFSNFEHDEKILKDKNIWRKGDNGTFNVFTNLLPHGDEKTLVNLTDFEYKIKKETLCENESVLLLIAVSSAPGNQLHRKIIRETWGRPDSEVKVVFLLGDSNNPDDTKALQIEDTTFHDIVQGNFLDSYKNMTYKSVMSLKYAIYNCPKAIFFMKSDDDVLINTPLLKNFLKNDLKISNRNNSIFCTVNYARTPIRDSTGVFRKWYLSYEEWPEERFPLYCAGWYFIAPLDVAFNIYRHAQNSTFFWIDDVFLTGVAARNVHGLKYVDISSFTLANRGIGDVLNGNLGQVPFLLGAMNMAPENIRILWNYILSMPVQQSILEETNYTISYQTIS